MRLLTEKLFSCGVCSKSPSSSVLVLLPLFLPVFPSTAPLLRRLLQLLLELVWLQLVAPVLMLVSTANHPVCAAVNSYLLVVLFSPRQAHVLGLLLAFPVSVVRAGALRCRGRCYGKWKFRSCEFSAFPAALLWSRLGSCWCVVTFAVRCYCFCV